MKSFFKIPKIKFTKPPQIKFKMPSVVKPSVRFKSGGGLTLVKPFIRLATKIFGKIK